MDLIVAVYDDWGIGKNGTQPVALSADRKFFRETTRGATVIVGRKTLADFPGGKPLPNRTNIVLTRKDMEIEGVEICHSPEEAVAFTQSHPRTFVIGGGSVYKQMLNFCENAYVTKVHCTPESDTYFPDLDAEPDWYLSEVLQSGNEDGTRYEMCLYKKKV